MSLKSSSTGETANDVGTPHNRFDPERLRDVTAILSTPFKGLWYAVFGAALTAVKTVDLYWQGSRLWTGLGVPLLGVAAIAAILASFFYIPRYYTSRFGWVQPKQLPPLSTKEISLVLALVFGVGFMLWLGADLLQHFVQAPVNFQTLLQSVVTFCVIVSVAFTARGKSMLVRLTIWGAFVAVQGLVAVIPLWVSLNPRLLLLWKLLNAGSTGILLMVMGLSDHVAMVHMLPKRIEEDDRE